MNNPAESLASYRYTIKGVRVPRVCSVSISTGDTINWRLRYRHDHSGVVVNRGLYGPRAVVVVVEVVVMVQPASCWSVTSYRLVNTKYSTLKTKYGMRSAVCYLASRVTGNASTMRPDWFKVNGCVWGCVVFECRLHCKEWGFGRVDGLFCSILSKASDTEDVHLAGEALTFVI